MASARLHVHAHGKKRFVIALKYEGENKYRYIIACDLRKTWSSSKKKSLEQRVAKTKEAFNDLSTRINAYRLKTEAAIDKACQAILKKYKTQGLFEYTLINDPVVTYKNKKRGRPSASKPVEKVAVVQDRFCIDLRFDESAFNRAASQAGYYPWKVGSPEKIPGK